MPAALTATGYHGPPPLTLLRALTQWRADPWALAFLALVGLAYLVGVRRARRAGSPWPAGRMIAFGAGGLGFGVLATCSFLAVYYPVLFYVRAVQTVLLVLAMPLFLALGRPVTLIAAVSPASGRLVRAAVSSRLARILTFPAITSGILVLTPFLLYFTPWFVAGFHSGLARELTHLALPLPGLLFFWTLLRVDPVPRQYPYLVALWISAAEVVGDAILGLAVIASNQLIAGSYYHSVGRPWGPRLATDQVLGGGVLWILGDIVGLPFVAAILIAMLREDESQAKEIDAELDAREAASRSGPAVLVPGEGPVPGGGPAPETGPVTRPWWLSDPRFGSRFAPVDGAVPGRDEQASG